MPSNASVAAMVCGQGRDSGAAATCGASPRPISGIDRLPRRYPPGQGFPGRCQVGRDAMSARSRVHGALELQMLGPLGACRGDEQLALGGRRQRAVLGCLLLEPDRDVSIDRIIDTVWTDARPPGVLSTVQTYVFHLRQVLEPPRVKGSTPSVIRTAPGGYRLNTTGLELDARRFEQLVSAGRSALPADPTTAGEVLAQGLVLWRGEVLSDLDLSHEAVSAP